MKALLTTLLLACLSSAAAGATHTAVFAGGCFWCLEHDLDEVDGVLRTTSGFTGGHVKNPGYKQVTTGTTGHYESVRIEYDPARVTYEQLLDTFWRNIDPFDAAGQFCDKGPQYRAVIFYADEKERELAEQSLAAIQQRAGKHKVVTQILPAGEFYPAEDYHQDYYKKNPIRYNYYRFGCGRDRRLKEVAEILGFQDPLR